MKKSKSFLIWTVALIVLIAAAYTFYSKNKPDSFGLQVQPDISQDISKESGDNPAANEDKQNDTDKIMAPDFELKDLDGNTVKLSDYRGKIVILNFWAVWCQYCVLEMPDFNEVDHKLKEEGDAVILAINVEEPEEKVRDFVESNKLGMKILLDKDGTVASTYGVTGYPNTFILNTDGSLYAYIPGATDKETLEKLIEKVRNGEPLK